MNTENYRDCPICKSTESNIIKNITIMIPEEYKLPSKYNIVSCSNCGFCYADTSATEEQYDYYYKNCNIYATDTKNRNNIESEFSICKDVMLEILDKDSTLLNIGVGNADFEIEGLKNGYKNIIGLDPSKNSMHVLEKNGIKGILGSIYETNKELIGKIDGVFAFYTFEHLLNPRLAIEQMIKYLKPNGKIFICVPDYELVEKSQIATPNHFNQEHINYFSEVSLNNLLSIYGFKPIHSKKIIYKATEFDEYSVMCVYAKDDCIENNLLDIDLKTKLSIKEYLKDQEKVEDKYAKKIKVLIDRNEPVIIWGTGALTMNLLTTTDLNKCNIIAYTDNNKSKIGTIFNNKYIISPEKLSKITGTIVIASMLYSKDIEKQIEIMGLSNEVITLN